MNLQEARGHWALVTGASSGIGQEFCHQLAAVGLHVMLVARRKERLAALAQLLEEAHGIRTQVLAQDLSQPQAARAVKRAVSQADLRIRLLINNAGFGLWGRFEKSLADEYERMVQLVASTPIALCRYLYDDLASFPSSAIINVSSPAAYQPMPFKSVYGSAKACLHQFSLALYEEWKERGIQVQTLVPGPTHSEIDAKGGAYKCRLTEERRPPGEVVKASLAGLGRDHPVLSTFQGTYRQRVFAGVFPTKIVTRTAAWMFRPPEGTPESAQKT